MHPAVLTGQKLSIVEINMRKIVRKLVASGKLPANLVAAFDRWKELDAISPARKTYSRATASQF